MATNTRGILHFNLSTASFFSGIGMAYTVERKQYWHLPLCVLFPFTYSGYQLYQNKYNITNYFKEMTTK